MDRKRFWLNSNESVGYSHPKINQVRNEDNDDLYLELDRKRKIINDSDENDWVNSKKSKF